MIIQIMPAKDGERAVFAGDDKGLKIVQLTGWALVNSDADPDDPDICNDCKGHTRIAGFANDDLVDEFGDFMEYLEPGENPSLELMNRAEELRNHRNKLEANKDKLLDEVSKPEED